MFVRIFIIIFFSIQASILIAQTEGTASISGKIQSSEGTLPGAIVMLKGTTLGAQVDEDGFYSIHSIDAGTYTVLFHSVGFKKDSIRVSLSEGQSIILNKTMAHDTVHHEVVIVGKTDIEEVKQQSYNVNVIDAAQYANTTSDVNQVLNKSTGVRIREEGGLGSSFNFMLNGFSGNQVRFFIDGIPMTNFGEALTLNNIPINLAERIEVYKGVVPVWLGADALGGAVNVVTNSKIRNYVDASYSYGSFNTHRASLNTRFTDSSGFTVSANAYLNYSDNNFSITTKVADPVSGVFGPEQKFRHFHDRYKSAGGIFEIGVIDKKYADRLLFGVIVSGNDKQIQQGATMQKVVGEAYKTNVSVIPTLKYKKDHFIVKRLSVSLFASYNFSNNQSIDTSSRKYNWDGTVSPPSIYKASRGELNDYKTLYVYNDRNALTTTNLNYEINSNHSFGFNHTFNNYIRKQKDEFNPARLPEAAPVIRKHSMGLGYKLNAFHNRLSATVFAKLFLMNSDLANGAAVLVSSSTKKTGYGAALSYFLIPAFMQVKLSYEDTYRMPEANELLGDGLNVLSNPNLKPEHSKNVNIGLRIQKDVTTRSNMGAEFGFIYRNATDFIRSKVSGVQSVYENMRSVRVTGFEAGLNYRYNKMFFFEINGTYQNIINTDKFDPPGTPFVNDLYLLRLPNTPFIFGNASMDIQFRKIAFSHAHLNLNLSTNYVESFYLYWPTLGDPEYKRDIPTQFTQNVSLTYSLREGRYNISFECKNLTDVKVYDYFYIQKPGRSFSVKLRYFFKK